MNELFNTPFELSLRAIIVLNAFRTNSVSLDRIVAFDHIAIYAKKYGVGEINLHGENIYGDGELAAKRTQMQEGLKNLVLNDYVRITYKNTGIEYQITNEGKDLFYKLNDDYATTYMQLLSNTARMYSKYSDLQLMRKLTRSTTLPNLEG